MAEIRKQRRFERRKVRVRIKVQGTSERPRLNVFRSNAHIYAQIIDDLQGKTLVSASSRDAAVRKQGVSRKKSELAQVVGTLLAERAKTANISKVVFDRGGRLFHGRIKALAQACRDGGLNF